MKTSDRSAKTVLAVLILTTASGLPASPAGAGNWPQWRGPDHDGTSGETDLPTSWSREENLKWRLQLPGPAASTPIVWEDRIFLTSTRRDSDDLLVMAIGTDGKLLWERALDQGARTAAKPPLRAAFAPPGQLRPLAQDAVDTVGNGAPVVLVVLLINKTVRAWLVWRILVINKTACTWCGLVNAINE